MFRNCEKLVGGKGTTYDSNHLHVDYAHIDGGTDNPGYFTDIADAVYRFRIKVVGDGVVRDATGDTRYSADMPVKRGNSVELKFIPDDGWKFASFVVDDVDMTSEVTPATDDSPASYTYQNVTGIVNVLVTFVQQSMEPYADDKKDSFKDAMSVGPFETLPSVVWKDYRESITTVVFDSTFVDCTTLTSTANWFAYCSNLKTINGLSYLKTDSVTNMNHMFYRCSGLRDLDLTTFNTANVTDMSSFIEGCSGLLAIDMTSFNTENVINMGWMFGGCSSLPVFNLVSFNTDKVTDMRYMFSQCENLKTIYVGDGWSTKSVTESVSMFSDCYVLVGAAGTVYNENNTDVTYAHIDEGASNPGYFTDKNAEEVPDTVETPTFEFEYIWDNYLTIKTETEDAEIYYTMNGRMLEREDANFGYNTLGRYGNWKAWGDNLQEAKSEYNEDVYSGYYGSNYVLKLTSRVDSVMESAQLGYRFNTALTKNDYYTVHFQARSVSGNGQIQFFCQNDTLTTKYRSAADTMAIGKEWADYEYTVKIDNDSTNQIVLNFGGVADTYYIDNVLFGPVISDTINGNLRTHYENPIEMRDNVTITAVAVKDGMAESKTAIYDYFYEGWIMLRDTYEKCRMALQECYGDPNVPLQDVDAMSMRLEDMLYTYYERRTEKRFDDNELLYAAEDMLERVDMIYQMKHGFVIDGVAYHAVDSTQVEVRKPLGYYSNGYKGAIAIAPEVFFNNINFRVTSVTDDAFADSELGAIVWNAEFTVPDNVNTMVNNPNLLVYVNSDALAPKNITNVVINGVAKNIILVDATTENGSFLVPESFTAEQISYERTFNQETMVGICRGWESIALPFDVQTITHEKQGAISPFGRGDSNKHFWLRRLGSNGFVQADKMEANVPYIIAMPNSSEYSEQYNLPGRVTFSATNAIVPITEERVLSLSDSTIMMIPTMQRLGRSSRYYAINVGEVRGQYLEGSVFERDYREIRPFEAYTTHAENAPAPRFVPIDDIIGGNMTGIEDVRSQMSDGRSDIWYDLNGRRLQKEPAQKGVYLRNGRKVIIR